jgi:glycerophosphoryl diester phosphodiesterase
LGAQFIETDLHLTRDARFVAIHDDVVQRTTNGTGRVRDLTLAELRGLDAGKWFDRDFSGEKVPTLEEVLEFGRAQDVVFYLEIKFDRAWGMDRALVAALQAADAAARTVVISFDPAAVDEVRRLDPSLMTGLLIEDPGLDALKAATDVGARQICIRYDQISHELCGRARRAGLPLVTWTVNEADEMRAAIGIGVDGIMTDLPDRLRALLEDREDITIEK